MEKGLISFIRSSQTIFYQPEFLLSFDYTFSRFNSVVKVRSDGCEVRAGALFSYFCFPFCRGSGEDCECEL